MLVAKFIKQTTIWQTRQVKVARFEHEMHDDKSTLFKGPLG